MLSKLVRVMFFEVYMSLTKALIWKLSRLFACSLIDFSQLF